MPDEYVKRRPFCKYLKISCLIWNDCMKARFDVHPSPSCMAYPFLNTAGIEADIIEYF